MNRPLVHIPFVAHLERAARRRDPVDVGRPAAEYATQRRVQRLETRRRGAHALPDAGHELAELLRVARERRENLHEPRPRPRHVRARRPHRRVPRPLLVDERCDQVVGRLRVEQRLQVHELRLRLLRPDEPVARHLL